MPGRIIQNMRRVGSINPVFMLDEIDKVSSDFRGDPSAALLEALDPEQNFEFSDHYLEVSYNLSKVLFITTANLLYPIPPALQDRLEVIEFSSYMEGEKLEIARQFLIPRQLNEHGLADISITIPDNTVREIIQHYTNESGVRNLERKIGRVCRKITRRLAEQKTIPKIITRQTLARFLGPATVIKQLAEGQPEVGVSTGLAYTQTGGDILTIEVVLMPGKGKLTQTGQLGDVMKESIQAALSFTRSHTEAYQIDPTDFEQKDIHLHVPEGAIPKDGPSAGITMATAIVSAFSGYKVRHDVAMTGEITLRGRVLAIGGFKEKLLAAHRAGIKTVIAPAGNKKDLVNIPKKIQREMEIKFVERMETVLEIALVR
jgi:ATP-dependent Lon protease